MDYEEFKNEVLKRFTEFLPESLQGMKIYVREEKKVNEILDAISLIGRETSVSGTVYINDLYHFYQVCGDFEKTLSLTGDRMEKKYSELLQVYDQEKVNSLFSNISEKVFYQLINTDLNEELLKTVPHRNFLDLSVVYKQLISSDERGTDSIMITNDIAESLELEEADLYQYAAANTQELFPMLIINLNDLIYRKLSELNAPDIHIESSSFNGNTMFVLTNNTLSYGASAMLYKDSFFKLAEDLGTDLYVLPTSIHEVMIFSTEMGHEQKFLDMINEGNKEIAPKDRLSNNIYYYDRGTDSFTLIKNK